MSQQKTILVVTIDTEEDNWGQYRSGITCHNIGEIPRLQTIFDSHGVIPTYLVTYQVCQREEATRILSSIHNDGKCEIGAHLHPWNTPPETESFTEHNSMLKNLPAELQLAKLQTLSKKIESEFGVKPRSFRAGRWGLGSETVDALSACGFTVDTSVTPTMSWADEGNGPVYKETLKDPYYLSAMDKSKVDYKSILEISATIGYNRWPFGFWNNVYSIAEKKALRPFRLLGILNKTSILRKIWLSPEGMSTRDMITLADLLIKHDAKVLNLSFHSNTLLPGKTPFVKTPEEANEFYQRIDDVLKHLQASTHLLPLSLTEAASEINAEDL